jgi:hypothetical protein
VTAGGSGYKVGDVVTIADAAMDGRSTAAKFTLVEDDLARPRTVVTTLDALIGSASTAAGEGLEEAITDSSTVVLAGSITTSGTGSGLALTYTSTATAITSITVTTGGTGYRVGDTITIAAAAMPGRSTDAVFTLVTNDLVPFNHYESSTGAVSEHLPGNYTVVHPTLHTFELYGFNSKTPALSIPTDVLKKLQVVRVTAGHGGRVARAANLGDDTVVTLRGHPFQDGDLVRVTEGPEHGGMAELAVGNIYVVAVARQNTFVLAGVESSRFSSDGVSSDGQPDEGGTSFVLVTSADLVDVERGATTALHAQVVQVFPITNISQSYPAVVIAPNHPFRPDDVVSITGVRGMVEINGGHHDPSSSSRESPRAFVVGNNVTQYSFDLVEVDSRLFHAYTTVPGIPAREAPVVRKVLKHPFQYGDRITVDGLGDTMRSAVGLQTDGAHFIVGDSIFPTSTGGRVCQARPSSPTEVKFVSVRSRQSVRPDAVPAMIMLGNGLSLRTPQMVHGTSVTVPVARMAVRPGLRRGDAIRVRNSVFVVSTDLTLPFDSHNVPLDEPYVEATQMHAGAIHRIGGAQDEAEAPDYVSIMDTQQVVFEDGQTAGNV